MLMFPAASTVTPGRLVQTVTTPLTDTVWAAAGSH